MNNNNLVEIAQNIINFKQSLIDICRQQGIRPFPTDEEIGNYIEKHGYDTELFIRQRTIAKYPNVIRLALLKTLSLDDETLAWLFNIFVEFGELAIIDLNDDRYHIISDIPLGVVTELRKKGIRFVQFSNGCINILDNKISDLIVFNWGCMFESIMKDPENYIAHSIGNYIFQMFFPAIKSHIDNITRS